MTRKDTHIGFEGTPDLKARVLQIVEETDRSMAKIMRAFTWAGIAKNEREGDSMFRSTPPPSPRGAVKKVSEKDKV